MSKLAWRINSSALLLILLLGGYFWYTIKRPPALVMPASGLLNQSSNHKYDRALRASIRAFQDRTKIQLGLILQNQLPKDVTIEQQAAKNFKELRLGQQEQHNAVLLIWSEQEHLFKIMVDPKLVKVFPDNWLARLEQAGRSFMLSNAPFAQRDFLTEIIPAMSAHYLEFKKSGQMSEILLPQPDNSHAMTQYFASHGGSTGRGYAATADQLWRDLPALLPQLEREMQPDKQAAIVLQRYLRSLQLGLGTPLLPLLTEGSRFYRIDRPRAAGYLQRLHSGYQNSLPHRIVEQGALAVVLFTGPAQPVLMRKNERGQWLVDEAKAQAYFIQGADGSYRPKYMVTPYAFAWPTDSGVYQNRSQPPALIDMTSKLVKSITQAENMVARQPQNADHFVKLAEWLHYEMAWLEAAAPLYEKALQLAPQRSDLEWRLLDLYLQTNDINGAERHFMSLLKKTPDDNLLQQHYKLFQKNYG
ncbi:MAG: hypothetical protein RL748_2051 [Pseudomonadota bacterium]|jgi:tetratricopeptide (TPR) repeat protein